MPLVADQVLAAFLLSFCQICQSLSYSPVLTSDLDHVFLAPDTLLSGIKVSEYFISTECLQIEVGSCAISLL